MPKSFKVTEQINSGLLRLLTDQAKNKQLGARINVCVCQSWSFFVFFYDEFYATVWHVSTSNCWQCSFERFAWRGTLYWDDAVHVACQWFDLVWTWSTSCLQGLIMQIHWTTRAVIALNCQCFALRRTARTLLLTMWEGDRGRYLTSSWLKLALTIWRRKPTEGNPMFEAFFLHFNFLLWSYSQT